jgi:hypothetical protein
MSKLDEHYFQISIDIMQGGFILNYPKSVTGKDVGNSLGYMQAREIFTSQQKLSKKIKEVLDEITNEADTAQK